MHHHSDGLPATKRAVVDNGTQVLDSRSVEVGVGTADASGRSLTPSSARCLVACTFWLAGCGQSHPGPETVGGYPADTPTRTLTTRDAWEPLCEWARGLRESELERYWCGADLIPVADEPADFPKAVQSWSVAACINAHIPPSADSCLGCPCGTACDRTVGEFAACMRSRVERPCFRMPGEQTPECDWYCRCSAESCVRP